MKESLNVEKGQPKPFGTQIQPEGVNFALFSKNASQVTLCLLDPKTKKLVEKFPFDPKVNKTGDIWHIFIKELKLPLLYAYQVDGPKEAPHYYNIEHLVLDPYAKILDSEYKWGEPREHYHLYGVLDNPKPFDWQKTQKPNHPLCNLVIYEMHVRGFTNHPSSKVKYPGTYLGMIEKIPYLKDLGVTAIELLPIFEFNETENPRINPDTKKPLLNYWGYSTMSYFSPMNRYAANQNAGEALEEVKTLVREFHKAGIEVFLDVVFNHTGEKQKRDITVSFLGIDRLSYYLLNSGKDTNYTGCGNTVNTNHPAVQQFILDSLHYWVTEMQIDGFRFDLASIMNRDMKGRLQSVSPLIKALSHDPILAKTKLIAEPWDLEAFQLGGFLPEENRWQEWNGRFRDSIRSFIKGDLGSKNEFAKRLTGSEDIFPERTPYASVNFITAHDGFSLDDLVSYNKKHNLSNGENNRDGNSHNISWNCGVEGFTNNSDTLGLRTRQKQNFLIGLFLSSGIPMLYMGDEYGHSKNGNNNTYCQDSELNWFLWDEPKRNEDFHQFVKKLIRFRKDHNIFKKEHFLKEEDIIWHSEKPNFIDWNNPHPLLAFTLVDKEKEQHIYAAFNPTNDTKTVTLPSLPASFAWFVVFDTFAEAPHDSYYPDLTKSVGLQIIVQSYSSVVLKALPFKGKN